MTTTTTRRDSSAGRHQAVLSPLREAKSARSLLAAVEDEEAVGKIRRPPSPLALPPLEEIQKPEEEKRVREGSKERKMEDPGSKLLKAQTVETKGEADNRSKRVRPFYRCQKQVPCLFIESMIRLKLD